MRRFVNSLLNSQSRPLVRLVVVLALVWPVPALAQRHAITVDDFLSLRSASDPRISPDGKWVAFTVSQPALDRNANVTRIWVVGTSGGSARQVTDGSGSERSARWLPDGSGLAFVSTREGGAQIWRAGPLGEHPAKLTTIPSGVNDFQWSSDGRSIYLTSDVKWPGVQEVDRRNGAFPTDAKIWTSLMYRHWDEWRVGRRSHLFRLTVADGRVQDLTPFDADVPPIALGGNDIAQSTLGTELAIVYNADSVVATSTNNDVWVMSPDGTGRQAITTNPANDNSPAYSPDGRWLAYLAQATPGFESDRQRIMLYERATGRRQALTDDWDRSVGAITWTPDSRTIIAEAQDRGEGKIFAVDAASGAPTAIVTGGVNSSVQVSPDGSFLVFVRQTATMPPEVWRADINGRGLRQLSHLNDEALAQLALAPAEEFTFRGALGATIAGWIIKPPEFDASKRYPLIYLVHGGPQGAWLDEWSQRWNYQMFAARGYVVAAVNFHGSTGYGQSFTNSISRNWGGLPYDDLMAGLDYVAKLPYVDSLRMGAAGASYGGYMIYWMAGHTRRFKALVAHDGVFNPLSMAGSTEELWFPTWEFGGTPLSGTARALMEKWSPANFVTQWTTPMLIVHNQLDYRVDFSEGLQAFTALKLRGVPAKFLAFPDEGHWVTKPRNRRVWWGVVLDWLDGWLKAES
jgi:dipeptidyl aminopeptidase/acylaminoacyl peptidase